MTPSLTKKIAWVVGAWLSAHVVLIAGHVLLVFLYSMTVAPDRSAEDYQAFARASGPWFSILFGFPVFYLLGRILRRRLPGQARPAGLVAWGLYSATDLTVVLLFEAALSPLLVGQWLVSQSVKLAAVLASTRGADSEATS